MNIEKDTAVTLRFKVTDLQGKLLEESKAPMVYLHGGYGNTLPKIEEALEGKTAGYQTTLELQRDGETSRQNYFEIFAAVIVKFLLLFV